MTYACQGKTRFTSMRLAMDQAHRLSHKNGRKFNTYHCRECDGFHVGSRIGKKKNPKKEQRNRHDPEYRVS